MNSDGYEDWVQQYDILRNFVAEYIDYLHSLGIAKELLSIGSGPGNKMREDVVNDFRVLLIEELEKRRKEHNL